jgi:hypothetical protein
MSTDGHRRLAPLLLGFCLVALGCTDKEDSTKDSEEGDPPLCADGTWAGWTDPEGLVFVTATGDDNLADGSAAHPYGSVRKAILGNRGVDPLRIAMGPGEFFDDFGFKAPLPALDVRPRLEVSGCGPGQTTLNPPAGTMLSLQFSGPVDVRLARMDLVWGWSSVLVLEGAHATLEDLVVIEAHRRGINIAGFDTEATLRDVTVQSTKPQSGRRSGTFLPREHGSPEGWGISLVGATVDMENVTITDSGGFGLFGDRGSLRARGLQIADTRNQWNPGQGTGIYLMHMREVSLEDCAVAGSVTAGIKLVDVLSSNVEGCSVANTLGDALGGGDGIVVRKAARLSGVPDRGRFSTRILNNVVTGSARMGIAVDGVDAEVSGNTTRDNGLMEGEGSIYVDPAVTLSGTDATAPFDAEATPVGPPTDHHGRPPPGAPPLPQE